MLRAIMRMFRLAGDTSLGVLIGMGAILFADVAAVQDRPPHLDPSYPNYQPAYPDAAQINGEQGNVVLNVHVGANGRVRTVRVMQSSGFDDLDNAAVEGVMAWRYVPAMRDGDKGSEWTKVTITYRLPTPDGRETDDPTLLP